MLLLLGVYWGLVIGLSFVVDMGLEWILLMSLAVPIWVSWIRGGGYGIVGCLISGNLIILSDPTINDYGYGLICFALVPLLIVVKGAKSYRDLLIYGLVTGVVVNVGIFYWLGRTFVVFGGVSGWASQVLLLIYSVLSSFKFVMMTLVLGWVCRNLKVSSVFIFPVLMVLVERFSYSLFPWYFGNFQVQNIYLIQIAEVFGVMGLSYCVILVNGLVFEIYMSWRRGVSWPYGSMVGVFLVILGGYIFGFLRVWDLDSGGESEYKTMRVGLIQPSTRYDEIYGGAREYEVEETYRDLEILSMEAINEGNEGGEDLDILIWPESAVPYPYGMLREEGFRGLMEDLIEWGGVPIFFHYYILRMDKGRVLYTSVNLMGEDLNLSVPYHKNKLLPFGEYIPLGEYFPELYEIFREVSRFSMGSEKKVFNFWKGKIIPLVCYEVLHEDFVGDFLDEGGEVIFNLTNDIWFGETKASEQHLTLSIFRAIENRVPIVRSTNSGVSGFVDIVGRRIGVGLGLYEKGYLVEEIKLLKDKGRTVYQKYGSLLDYGLLGVILWIILSEKLRFRRGARF